MKALVLAAFVLLVGFALAPSPSVHADGETGIVVIVNPGNADDRTAKGKSLQLDAVKSMFMLSTTKWSDKDKTAVSAFPMASDTDEAKLFLKKVLSMSQEELTKHWAKLKEDDGIDQPKGRKESSDVFKQVSKEKANGAIGYVSTAYYDGLKDDERAKVREVYRITDK